MVERTTFPNLVGLTELESRSNVDIKPTLLRVTTDLYVQKPTHCAEEERHYVELAVRLIDQVDAATRAIVAGRLANYAAAPEEVIDRLAQYRIEHGETKSAATSDAGETVPPEAAVEPPPATTVSPVNDNGDLSELFLGADAQDRQMILLHLEYSELPLADAPAPQPAHEAVRRLELAALTHDSGGFAQEIARTLGIGRRFAQRLVDDPSGEPVLVLTRALRMPADVLQRILLCLNPEISQSVLRVYELSKLYEEIELQSALRLIAIWQAADRTAPERPVHSPAHRPQHYDDNKAMPGMPARPAIRWEEHARRREGER